MKKSELSSVAAELARVVIDAGRVEGEDLEWWVGSLAVEVALEADDRGYDNASEIADEAARLYRDNPPQPIRLSTAS